MFFFTLTDSCTYSLLATHIKSIITNTINNYSSNNRKARVINLSDSWNIYVKCLQSDWPFTKWSRLGKIKSSQCCFYWSGIEQNVRMCVVLKVVEIRKNNIIQHPVEKRSLKHGVPNADGQALHFVELRFDERREKKIPPIKSQSVARCFGVVCLVAGAPQPPLQTTKKATRRQLMTTLSITPPKTKLWPPARRSYISTILISKQQTIVSPSATTTVAPTTINNSRSHSRMLLHKLWTNSSSFITPNPGSSSYLTLKKRKMMSLILVCNISIIPCYRPALKLVQFDTQMSYAR